jgi:hypothetical protein
MAEDLPQEEMMVCLVVPDYAHEKRNNFDKKYEFGTSISQLDCGSSLYLYDIHISCMAFPT